MFRFHKTLDVITLFHKASSPASIRVQTLLKQINANASQTATEDQASDHSAQTKYTRPEFQLEVTESAPTHDQLKSILEYVGAANISTVIKGAKNEEEALRKFRQDADSVERPIVVDWSNGRASTAGAKESEILKMIEALPKEE